MHQFGSLKIEYFAKTMSKIGEREGELYVKDCSR